MNKRHILIIDDTNVAAYMYKRYLQSEGYHVDIVHDRDSAIKHLQTFILDLILLGTILPEMSSIELIKEIRQNLRTSPIPIVLLTSNSDTTQSDVLEIGANVFIYRPLKFVDLLELVQKIIL